MIIIHIDYVDGTEVSHEEGNTLLLQDSTNSFTTNDLSFFRSNTYTHYKCDNVIIKDKHGRYIDRNELLDNTSKIYTDKFMKPGHNINRMLLANSFTWRQPTIKENKVTDNLRLVQLVDSDNNNVGLVKTDLTDTQIAKAIELFVSDDTPERDVFDKLNSYISVLGHTFVCDRVYVEVVNT